MWPDPPPSASGHWSATTCHQGLTAYVGSQWSISRAVKRRSDAPITRPDMPISSRPLARAPRPRHDRTSWSTPTPARQVTFRYDLEALKRDRTRPHACDRTHARVRSSFASHKRLRQCTSAMTGRRPCASGHIYCAASGKHIETGPLHRNWPDARRVSPVTTWPAFCHCFIVTNTSFTSWTSPPLLKYVNHQVYHLVHVC
jgi:hypothetical protein